MLFLISVTSEAKEICHFVLYELPTSYEKVFNSSSANNLIYRMDFIENKANRLHCANVQFYSLRKTDFVILSF